MLTGFHQELGVGLETVQPFITFAAKQASALTKHTDKRIPMVEHKGALTDRTSLALLPPQVEVVVGGHLKLLCEKLLVLCDLCPKGSAVSTMAGLAVM